MSLLVSAKKLVITKLPLIVLVLVVIASLWLRSRYLRVEPLSFDEGHWLMFGVLTNTGYPAYTETFVGIPPLALLTIQLGARLFSPTSLTLRYPMMVYSLVGIASIFWIFHSWKSKLGFLAGLMAAIFLSFDADAFHGSGSIMAEVPAVSMAVLSLALSWQYYYQQKRYWLVLSGVAFTLSLALKIFAVFLPAVVGLLILMTILPDEKRSVGLIMQRLVISGGLWLIGVAIPLVIFVVLYDPWAMYEQIYLFRLAVREVYLTEGVDSVSTVGNIIRIGQMMLLRAPLVIGAMGGAMIGWKHHRLDVWVWLAWLGLAAILMTSHAPLRGRYSVLLLPPLAALSGMAVAYGAYWLFHWLKAKGSVSLSRAIVLFFLIGFIVWTLVAPVKSAFASPALDTFAEDMRLERRDAIEFARTHTTTDDCLVTDDQRFALRANRLVPPALSETSKVLLLTGWITAEDIIREIEENDCALAVYALGRFDQFLPHLRHQLRELYFLEITFNENTIIYAVKKDTRRKPTISLGVQFGQQLVLEGIDLTPTPWQAGQEVQITAYWTALESPDKAYKIFLQLRNDQNETIASFDHFPFPIPDARYQAIPDLDRQDYPVEEVAIYPQKGMLPTNAWPTGSIIREVYTMQLPGNLPAGTYSLYLGLYDPATQVRLLTQTETGARNEILATQIEIIVAR